MRDNINENNCEHYNSNPSMHIVYLSIKKLPVLIVLTYYYILPYKLK